MIFKAIVEYEYPVEHKPPVKAEIVLHGDRVITDNIKWLKELKENNDVLEQIRAEIEALPRELPTDARNMVRRTRVLEIIDKYMKQGGSEYDIHKRTYD